MLSLGILSLHTAFQGAVEQRKDIQTPAEIPKSLLQESTPRRAWTNSFLSPAQVTTHPSLPANVSAALTATAVQQTQFPTTAARCIGKERTDQLTGIPTAKQFITPADASAFKPWKNFWARQWHLSHHGLQARKANWKQLTSLACSSSRRPLWKFAKYIPSKLMASGLD